MKEKDKEPVIVGGDRDEHGCIASAGYQWSEIKKDCIRVFELPLKLVSISGEQIAGIVFSKNKQKAEVFIAAGTFILLQKSKDYYLFEGIEESCFLENKNGKWQLRNSKDGEVTYQQE